MKIIQINCVYKYGSTGKLVYDLHVNNLKCGYESYVLYGRGVKYKEKNIIKISTEIEAKLHSLMSKLFSINFGYSFFSTKKCMRVIKKIKPDVVHLHCLNGNFINVYKLFNFLKNRKIKTVLTLHAEIMHTAGCEHAVDCLKWIDGCNNCNLIRGKISSLIRDDAELSYNLMRKSVEKFGELKVVGVSEWLTKRASMSKIFSKCVFSTIHNGINTEVFDYCNAFDEKFRKELLGKYEKIILFVTPNFYHPLKGGKYFLELSNICNNYKFIVIGFDGNTEIFGKNVCAISHISNQNEMAKYYACSDITVLFSKRETFSMIVAETLCCGTPIVGFKAGGPESIALQNYSSFVNQGDLQSMKNEIDRMISLNYDKEIISFYSKKEYSKEKMVEEYCKLYLN